MTTGRTELEKEEKRGRRRGRERMASGCCGTKKQKLSQNQQEKVMNGHDHGRYGEGLGSSSSTQMNGHNHMNGHGSVMPLHNGMSRLPHDDRIASPEMCYFCFDVLYTNLNNLEPPKTPTFTNEAL